VKAIDLYNRIAKIVEPKKGFHLQLDPIRFRETPKSRAARQATHETT